MLKTSHDAEACEVPCLFDIHNCLVLQVIVSQVSALQKQPRGGQGNVTVAKTKTATPQMCFKCLYLEGSLHDFQCAGRFGNSYSEPVTSSFNTEYKGHTWISLPDNQKKKKKN